MAAIPVQSAYSVSPTNETEIEGRTYMVAAAQILQGQCCLWDANRKLVLTGGTAPAAGVAIAGIAMRPERAGGQALRVLQRGFLWGYNLTGRALHDLVYAGANGTLDTAGTVIIGEILPFNASGDLAVWIDVTRSWGAA